MVVQSDGKILLNTYSGVARATAPAPAVASTSIITHGTGKNASATGVTITFNTAVNPALASNLKVYVLHGEREESHQDQEDQP